MFNSGSMGVRPRTVYMFTSRSMGVSQTKDCIHVHIWIYGGQSDQGLYKCLHLDL